MAYAAHPETRQGHPDTAWHVITTIMAVVGIVAAAIGAWMEWAPVDGTITVFDWTWNVNELSDLWAPFLMIGGGILAALPMGMESIRDWDHEASPWLITGEMLIALVGVAAVVVGVVLLF